MDEEPINSYTFVYIVNENVLSYMYTNFKKTIYMFHHSANAA